jgi:hypothetical protein
MPSYRRHPRAPLNVLLNKVMGESLFMCHAADISEDGIFLSKLLEPRYHGKEIGLEFTLPGDGEIIWARGEIVRENRRRRADGSAIKFTILPDAFRRLIKRYVDCCDLAAA